MRSRRLCRGFNVTAPRAPSSLSAGKRMRKVLRRRSFLAMQHHHITHTTLFFLFFFGFCRSTILYDGTGRGTDDTLCVCFVAEQNQINSSVSSLFIARTNVRLVVRQTGRNERLKKNNTQPTTYSRSRGHLMMLHTQSTNTHSHTVKYT